MPPKLGRATGNDGVNSLLLGRRDLLGLPGGVAIEAEDVGDFPLRAIVPGRSHYTAAVRTTKHEQHSGKRMVNSSLR